MTNCPLCGKPLENLENIIIRCHNQKCAALGSGDSKWWRRLARQVARLKRDTRKPSECKYAAWIDKEGDVNCLLHEGITPSRCCPCAAFKRKRGGE